MVDKIIELDNNENYVILDEKKLDNSTYCLGLKLTEEDKPTTEYLFFEEVKEENETSLIPVVDEGLKGILLTVFTARFVDMSYSI